MLKFKRSQWGIALALGLCSSAGSAAVINFDEIGDGRPLVGTDLPFASIANVAEGADVDALVPLTATGGVTVPLGARSVVLKEPSSDPFNQPNSDVLTLRANQGDFSTINNVRYQVIHLSFLSDTFGSVSPPADILPGNVFFLMEDGTLQNVSAQLNSGSVQISMRSDLATPEVPEPASVLLLGVGLAGLAAFRLRKSSKLA